MVILTTCVAAFVAAIQHDPFFWDTVQLASRHAHFFFENGLQFKPLPVAIDSGHPPLLGYYLAVCWTIFGKTLPVSHWAMFPFLWLNVILIWKTGRRIGGNKWALWLLPLVLLDPVVMGQSLLVSPDVLLLCGFLLALEGYFSRRSWVMATGVMLLCTVSMRGMMTAAAISAALLWLHRREWTWWLKNMVPPLVPGALLGLAFLLWHRDMTGWSGWHEQSPWAKAFQPVGAAGMLKNALILGWRWLDLGRVGAWVVAFVLLVKSGAVVRRNVWFPLWIIIVVALSWSALRYQYLSAHRYFLPAFVLFHFVVFYAVVHHVAWSDARKRTFLLLLVISFTGGHFWRYPRGTAVDWDSTTAHLPWHDLRADAVRFLDSYHVDFSTVGSAFPNLNTGENLLLNGDERQFAPLNFDQNQWVFASNIFNDIERVHYEYLERNWTLVYRQERCGVWVEVWRDRKVGIR